MPFVQVHEKKIHYRDCAPSNGGTPKETIVLVHGLGSTQNYYMAVTPALCAQGNRCISMDMTGSGRSPYTGIEQSVHSLASDIIGVMDALNISKAVIAGHSMSGFTVPHCAATWPDRVTGIVLLGPVYPSKEAAPVFEQRIEAVEKSGMEAMGETVPFGAVGPNATASNHAFIREVLMGTDAAGYISLCRVIASAYKSLPEYHKVKCPVLIIAGEEDKSAPVAGCQKIYDSVGTSEKNMVVQKGIGHWMCVEVPDDCADQILQFCKRLQQVQ